jgi:sugar O-acyltransferase (sialic acid O-acetyltransferase NeuD family)
MSKVIIFGVGRGADVATRYFRDDSDHEIVAYTVDDAYAADKKEFMGRPVIPFSRVETEIPPGESRMFVPLGFQRMNAFRAEKYAAAKAKGYTLESYVSSRLVAWEKPNVGENCLILEANVFNYDVKIGNNVVLWSACHIGDLCVVEDHAWISSHAVLTGEVTVGAHSFIGVNATISNYVRVGERSYIGANTLINKDTKPDGVYVTKGTSQTEHIDSARFLEMIKS